MKKSGIAILAGLVGIAIGAVATLWLVMSDCEDLDIDDEEDDDLDYLEDDDDRK